MNRVFISRKTALFTVTAVKTSNLTTFACLDNLKRLGLEKCRPSPPVGSKTNMVTLKNM
jgi:hypothetical protein